MHKKVWLSFLICLLMNVSFTWLISSERIRCFDLGGNGLKTALVLYDDNLHTMTLISPMIQLGKCPDDMRISKWIRKKMRHLAQTDLDTEIQSGYLFSFALAELKKLRKKPVKISGIPELFQIPAHAVSMIHDGNAHLLASLKALRLVLPDGVIWNIALGTGVGFGLTNSRKELRSDHDLKKFFEQEAWMMKEPLTQQNIWEAGGSLRGFDKIVAEQTGVVNHEAFAIFASRWKAFIDLEIISRARNADKSWAAPAAVIFTGGHIEYHGDRLIKELHAQGLEVPVFAGPKHAGILGAAWNAIESRK